MQFVPFISGPRNCLGQYFALLEARAVLATLLKVLPAIWVLRRIETLPLASQLRLAMVEDQRLLSK